MYKSRQCISWIFDGASLIQFLNYLDSIWYGLRKECVIGQCLIPVAQEPQVRLAFATNVCQTMDFVWTPCEFSTVLQEVQFTKKIEAKWNWVLEDCEQSSHVVDVQLYPFSLNRSSSAPLVTIMTFGVKPCSVCKISVYRARVACTWCIIGHVYHVGRILNTIAELTAQWRQEWNRALVLKSFQHICPAWVYNDRTIFTGSAKWERTMSNVGVLSFKVVPEYIGPAKATQCCRSITNLDLWDAPSASKSWSGPPRPPSEQNMCIEKRQRISNDHSIWIWITDTSTASCPLPPPPPPSSAHLNTPPNPWLQSHGS